MSDFDKEAEREKLREKYGEDDETDTRRMSELLLKGATMTNAHCEECNDPLFRHNGQTFCATCQANGQQSPTTQQAQQTQQTQQPQQTQQDNTADQSETAQQSDGVQQPTNGTQPSDDQPAHNDASTTAQQPSTPTGSSTPNQPSATPQASPPNRQPTTQSAADTDTSAQPPSRSGSAADLTTARESLVGTITRFSQQAAKADDPRRAKELLAAAREAAETLRALEFE